MIKNTQKSNKTSILTMRRLLTLAILGTVLLLPSIPLSLTSPPVPITGTWYVYYYSSTGCTGDPWTPTVKGGGGFAANAPPSSAQEPVITAGMTIYVKIDVTDATDGTYTYHLDGGNSPWPAAETITVSEGSAHVCFPVTITTDMANAVEGPACSVPEKIIYEDNTPGSNLDHLVLAGSTNGNGCSGAKTSSSIVTTVYDTGYCDPEVAPCPNTGGAKTPPAKAYALDSFYDTAVITVTGPAPAGTVTYYFFHNNECTGTPYSFDTVNVAIDGSVPNSVATGPLGAGDYSFNATYSGDDNYLPSVGACEPFTVLPAPASPPVISKTATPSYDVTYTWTIVKECSFDNVTFSSDCKENVPGSTTTVTVYYRVNVTHDEGTPSNWQVNGDITVTNNNVGPFTYDSVTDAINDLNAVCTVNTGSDGTNSYSPSGGIIPTKVTVIFPYTCTYSAAPSSDEETNTGTISWSDQMIVWVEDGLTHQEPLGAGSASYPVSWKWSEVTPDIIDGCVTVTDTNDDTLGTVCVDDVNPYIFYYDIIVNIPKDACQSVTNTATFTTDTTGTQDDDSSTVQICPEVSGFLTMGFWQNKNGQNIIKTYCGGTSGTSLYNYLTGFNPFKDISTGATCNGIATYVYNVVKAASASGSSMNAMLKAQMLATALDVYFSDPALGGNRINAPVPLGGVKIDLSNICGKDTSSAFGNPDPKCMTVNQLLTYAASQSNSGGSNWYGNVKATQELAKDTFDQVNNNKAYVCP